METRPASTLSLMTQHKLGEREKEKENREKKYHTFLKSSSKHLTWKFAFWSSLPEALSFRSCASRVTMRALVASCAGLAACFGAPRSSMGPFLLGRSIAGVRYEVVRLRRSEVRARGHVSPPPLINSPAYAWERKDLFFLRITQAMRIEWELELGRSWCLYCSSVRKDARNLNPNRRNCIAVHIIYNCNFNIFLTNFLN